MKSWKCPNCSRDNITNDNIVTVVCLCGHYYQEIKLVEEEDDSGREN